MNRLHLLCVLALSVVGPALASPAVPGTYSLSGIADAGGELELHGDGHYRWSVSAGSVNRSSTGRWVLQGRRIALSPDDPENPSGIARVPTSARWDDDAERQYLRLKFETEWAQVLARCPLLRVRIPPYPPSPEDPSKDWRAAAKSELQRAVAARSAAVRALAAWDRQPESSPEQEGLAKAAGEAMIAYEAAFSSAQEAHARGKLPAPDDELINLPTKCQVPRTFPASDALPDVRHPQIGIVIGNPETGSAYIGVKLLVRFSDGSQISTESGPGGWAILPVQPGKSVSAIALTVDIDQPERFTVPARLDGAGILIVDINPEALAVRALEPRRLTFEKDGTLKPDMADQGHYSKL